MQFATIIVAVIVLNQVVGPPLFKWSIKLVGESRVHAKIDFEKNRNALVFGLEHQSLDLARGLLKDNYSVEIASLERRKNIKHIKDLKIHFLEGLSVKCLESIDIKKFETVILMLSDDENYKVCELIFENIGTKTVIVRLFDSMYADKFHELGALVVDPSTAISKLIEQFVRSPIAASIILGEVDNKTMVDIKVSDKNLHGIALRDLRLPPDVLILSVKRKGQMLISHGYTRLRTDDIVTIVGSLESLDNISLQFNE
jgi:Trk K+ transport system NAD-binding subunit